MTSSVVVPPFATLVEALERAAIVRGREATVTFVGDDGERRAWPRGDLREAALRFARFLVRAGVAPGSALPIALPTSPELVIALLGALHAGARPSLLGMPGAFGDMENFTRRMGAIGTYLRARHVVTSAALAPHALREIPGATFLDVASGTAAGADDAATPLPPVTPADVALLQCTSGSTGLPKGVSLTHANLLANIAQITAGVRATPEDVVVSWLPLHHDMGVIGCLFFALAGGMDLVLSSPSRFLRRPSTWLEAISRYRGTLSPAPNFAYGYAAARVRDEEIAGVDLSSWRAAICGAEPIDAPTMRTFEARFAARGLRANVVLPCYGLAESSLAVTFHAPGTPLETHRIDRDLLSAEGRAAAAEAHATASEIVCCGAPLPGTRVRIVDAEGGRELAELQVGRILVQGPAVMLGYHELPELTAEVKKDGWLVTGDLGYLRGGKLYVTGREKDVIIIRGKCYAPTDFERAASDVEGVRDGAAVAFGVFDAHRGTELLHVVCEAETRDPDERAKLRERVMASVAHRTGIRPDVVHFVRRYALPKTTSGKLQRSKTRQMYLEERPSRSWRIF